MSFPIYIGFGDFKIHPHLFFETIAYCVALRLSLRNFRRDSVLTSLQRSITLIGGLTGALVGAKALVLVQHFDVVWQHRDRLLLLLLQGKTVVGALLGAVIGVEIAKKFLRVKESTGDVFVYPLIAGMAIGRLGCFFTGLSDQTYGIATRLPWGVDFGDGIARHPTQLYEIAFLLGLAIALRYRSRFSLRSGDLFKFYLISYLGFRFLIDFIKPDLRLIFGLTAIQLSCLVAIALYRSSWSRVFTFVQKTS